MTFFRLHTQPFQYGMVIKGDELKSLLRLIESAQLEERRTFNRLKEQIKKELDGKQ